MVGVYALRFRVQDLAFRVRGFHLAAGSRRMHFGAHRK